MTPQQVWLTQEAYDRLKAEYDRLAGPGRAEIASLIEAAREEGDLKENGGYHAAKDEQGKQEARIRQLKQLLENARVGAPARTDGVVGPGMTVTIRFVKDDEEVTFLLASREESGSPIDVYSPRSPLGAAIWARRSARRPPTRCRTAAPTRWRYPRGGPVRGRLRPCRSSQRAAAAATTAPMGLVSRGFHPLRYKDTAGGSRRLTRPPAEAAPAALEPSPALDGLPGHRGQAEPVALGEPFALDGRAEAGPVILDRQQHPAVTPGDFNGHGAGMARPRGWRCRAGWRSSAARQPDTSG